MVRQYGIEFPERPLMSTLSDLLGVPHFTTSRGSTVRRDFLDAVASALRVDGEHLDKDSLIRLLWETAQGRRMPADRLSPGATVTNRVLQEILDGLLQRGFESVPRATPPQEEMLLSTIGEGADAEFDPAGLHDERTRRMVEQAQREGQNTFRTAVLDAYDGQCAVTGTRVPAVLEAAHIAPYRGPRYNVVPNGLCLRADIHVLFDRGAIAVHEVEFVTLMKPHLEGSPYWDFKNVAVHVPRRAHDRPSSLALGDHRVWAGFGL